jgi:hypothetical protein
VELSPSAANDADCEPQAESESARARAAKVDAIRMLIGRSIYLIGSPQEQIRPALS